MFYLDDGGVPSGDHEWEVDLPNQSVLVCVKCANYECVRGGFDLSDVIRREMLRTREPQVAGQLVCGGWQDRERIGNYHCLTRLEYEIRAEYNSV